MTRPRSYYIVRSMTRALLWVTIIAAMAAFLVACYVIGQSK